MKDKILAAPVPTWREIIGLVKENPIEDCIFTAGSAVSVKLILEGFQKYTQRKSVVLLVPEFLYPEILNSCSEVESVLYKYPLDKDFEPDWKIIKERYKGLQIDAFIFVHYFGVEHDISRAQVFCENNGAILIEDCTHVLYGYGKMNKRSDFAIYSPHRFFPIPDGGIIMANQVDDLTNSIVTYIREKTGKGDQRRHWLWRLRAALYKLFGITAGNFSFELSGYSIDEINKRYDSISAYSKKIISSYSKERLKEIAYKRRENIQVISEVLRRVNPNIYELTRAEAECPLFAAYSLEKCENPSEDIEKIRNIGLTVQCWPLRKSDTISEKDDIRSSGFGISIPIHQNINIMKLASLIDYTIKSGIRDFSIEEVFDNAESKKRWNRIMSESSVSNINQDWNYGDVKRRADGWKVIRYILKDGETDIGIVQLLVKSIGPIPIAYRINKGPIFISEYENIDNEIMAMERLRQINPRRPIFFVPYTVYSVESLCKLIKSGWKLWNQFGFPSGTIDLRLSEEQIRSNLDSKWRNQLKVSEKKGYDLQSGSDRFDEMLKLYLEEQKEKGFVGIPSKMLKEMKDNETSLKVFYVLDRNQRIIAFDFFYIHCNDATYYVGWNSSEEGRENYLNNYLLYYSALELKKCGIRHLDLGGIEYIHTENIARFKDGMRPRHYKQVGELIKI